MRNGGGQRTIASLAFAAKSVFRSDEHSPSLFGVKDPFDPAKAWGKCVRETAKFVKGAGFTSAVIGLSGGLDSAVVAALAVDALGPDRVHGVLMPGPFSSEHSITDALESCKLLGIKGQEVSIDEPYQAFAQVLADSCGDCFSGLTSQNVQARCRMICLMALSNAYGWMVLNTGNLSEACLGYSTLYGDAIGAFAPIGGLLKTQVYAMARWRNSVATERSSDDTGDEDLSRLGIRPGPAPIPVHSIEKPPSAELAPGQEDETSIGLTYPVIDAILKAHLEFGLDLEGLVEAGFTERDASLVLSRMKSSSFKRKLLPPCVEI